MMGLCVSVEDEYASHHQQICTVQLFLPPSIPFSLSLSSQLEIVPMQKREEEKNKLAEKIKYSKSIFLKSPPFFFFSYQSICFQRQTNKSWRLFSLFLFFFLNFFLFPLYKCRSAFPVEAIKCACCIYISSFFFCCYPACSAFIPDAIKHNMPWFVDDPLGKCAWLRNPFILSLETINHSPPPLIFFTSVFPRSRKEESFRVFFFFFFLRMATYVPSRNWKMTFPSVHKSSP